MKATEQHKPTLTFFSTVLNPPFTNFSPEGLVQTCFDRFLCSLLLGSYFQWYFVPYEIFAMRKATN